MDFIREIFKRKISRVLLLLVMVFALLGCASGSRTNIVSNKADGPILKINRFGVVIRMPDNHFLFSLNLKQSFFNESKLHGLTTNIYSYTGLEIDLDKLKKEHAKFSDYTLLIKTVSGKTMYGRTVNLYLHAILYNNKTNSPIWRSKIDFNVDSRLLKQKEADVLAKDIISKMKEDQVI